MGFFEKFHKKPAQPAGPLVPYKSEFRNTCVEWANEKLSSQQAHVIFKRLHDEVYQLACVAGKIPTQAGYDFFNLAGEMAKATDFDNADKTIAFDAIALVDYHLGDIAGAGPWLEIMKRCSGFDRMALNSCQVCGLVWPQVYHNQFTCTPFAFCMACGDLFGTRAWDANLHEILCSSSDERDAIVEKTGILVNPCPCGGELAFAQEKACPACKDDLVDTTWISPYFYMQTHNAHPLEHYIVRRVSLRTQSLQGELLSARNRLLEMLGDIHLILQHSSSSAEAANIQEIANTIQEDLQAGLQHLFRYYAAGFTSLVITPADSARATSQDLLNANTRFRALRSEAYRQATSMKYLVNHLKQ